MQLLDVAAVGTDYIQRWLDGTHEPYQHWIEYRTVTEDSEHRVRIGFGMRPTSGRDRRRIVIWIDNHTDAEFIGADDFNHSGDILSAIRMHGDAGERNCRYPEEPVPARSAG